MTRRWTSARIAAGVLVLIAGTAIGAEPALAVALKAPGGVSGTDSSDDGAFPGPLPPSVDNTGETELTPPATIADPIEPFNRAMFTFNDKAYYWFFKPVAKGYNVVVPQVVRVSVRNFFSNLSTPIRVANNLLQGKFRATGTELLRFAVNSTFGIGGLFDPAYEGFHLEGKDADLGQTLGRYGLGQGMYLVLPLLGPTTLRDGVGRAGDLFLDPLSYIKPTEASIGVNAYKMENGLSLRIGDYEDLTEPALDPYVAVRDAYVQHRAGKVADK